MLINSIWYDYHHLKPRSRGGSSLNTNLLFIKRIRHCYWHKLWDIHLIHGKNCPRTLDEIILLLKGLSDETYVITGTWRCVWHELKPSEVLLILLRLKRMKMNQKKFYYI